MVFSSIGKNILPYPQLELLTKVVEMLINKRPLTCKQALIEPCQDINAKVLTPEMLLRGYDVPAVSIVPDLSSVE